MDKMDEQDVAAMYIAEMHALLPVIEHHLATLRDPVPASVEDHRLASLELAHLGTAITDLCDGLHVEDCAQAAAVFAGCFAESYSERLHPVSLLTNCANLLAYLQQRLATLTEHGRAVPPTDAERQALSELVRDRESVHPGPEESERSQEAGADSGSSVFTAGESGTQLTAAEQALLHSFQTAEVRRRRRPTPVDASAGDPPDEATTAGAVPTVTDEELDSIPPNMKRFFLVETGEDVQDIRRMVLAFEQQPGDQATLSEMGRLAHKMKGAAATLGYGALASITLVYEDVIRAIQSGSVGADSQAIGTLTGLLALLEAALAAAAAGQPSDAALGELVERSQNLRDALVSTREPRSRAGAPDHSASPRESGDQIPIGPAGAPGDAAAPPRINEIESLLRVEIHRLDRLMTHVNALALNRATFIQMRDDILRLQSELDQALERLDSVSLRVTDLNPQQLYLSPPDGASGARRQMLAVHPADPAWDELEMERFTEFDQALRQLSEVVADTTSASKYLRTALTRLDQIGDEQATITHDIQRDVMQIRLVHLEDLMPRIQLEARRLAGLLGKTISFSVRGQMTEIDRNISEALAEPLIQLVRNAVVHGIESTEERVEFGKGETGNIWIHAYYVGSEVVIEVGDDGRGVNPYRLAASAVAMGLISAESARHMVFTEALDLMFMPGITTFHEAQMVAGRGIGLDEVRTAIRRLKGTIQVRSEPGKGSVFRIRVPISLSIVRALGIQVAGQPFAVPFSSVLQMVSVTQSDVSSGPTPPAASGQSTVVSQWLRVRVEASAAGRSEPVKGPSHLEPAESVGQMTSGVLPVPGAVYEEVPALRLADLLGFESSIPTTQLALIIEVGRRRVALLVDQVSDDQEVVVQTLPPHLRRRAIRGTTVTPDGVVQLLLDLPELLQGALDGGRTAPALRRRPLPQAQETAAPRVLVVDDSMSIRGALELTLTRAGFHVQLARDGIEAFEMMRVAVPKVMVLDIEMPRLDGFELLSVMQDSPQFSGVRVIMLTSRAADKHREQALKLGATAYLIKPCPQETLIETIRMQLIDQTSPV